MDIWLIAAFSLVFGFILGQVRQYLAYRRSHDREALALAKLHLGEYLRTMPRTPVRDISVLATALLAAWDLLEKAGEQLVSLSDRYLDLQEDGMRLLLAEEETLTPDQRETLRTATTGQLILLAEDVLEGLGPTNELDSIAKLSYARAAVFLRPQPPIGRVLRRLRAGLREASGGK